MKRLSMVFLVLFFLIASILHSSEVLAAAKRPKPTPPPKITPTITPIPTPLPPTPTSIPTPTPGPATDIGVAVTTVDTITVYQDIPYTISVTNYGPVEAVDVEFCAEQSIGNDFALVAFNQGNWDSFVIGGPGSNRYSNCNVWGIRHILGVGETATMDYSIVTGTYYPVVTNTVKTSAYAADPNLVNNTQTVSTNVSP